MIRFTLPDHDEWIITRWDGWLVLTWCSAVLDMKCDGVVIKLIYISLFYSWRYSATEMCQNYSFFRSNWGICNGSVAVDCHNLTVLYSEWVFCCFDNVMITIEGFYQHSRINFPFHVYIILEGLIRSFLVSHHQYYTKIKVCWKVKTSTWHTADLVSTNGNMGKSEIVYHLLWGISIFLIPLKTDCITKSLFIYELISTPLHSNQFFPRFVENI